MSRSSGHSTTSRRFGPPSLARRAAGRRYPWSPHLEALENRDLPSMFLVTTTQDSGPGSLRQALLDANGSPGLDSVLFQIGQGGSQSIRPLAPLPLITDPITLDGTTQPGYTGIPLIELSGELAGGTGLIITAGKSRVQGLVINGFSSSGLWLQGQGGNVILGNFIGTDLEGRAARPNLYGVRVNSNNNLIGGTTPASRNLVSGNSFSGIYVENASGNLVQGNYIGTDVTGLARLGNGGRGISFWGGSNNTAGGVVPGSGNVIAGNSGNVSLSGRAHVVQGNLIDTDASGSRYLGRSGISTNGSDHMIGGTAPGAGNVVGEIQLGTSTGSGIVVQGNYIGVDVTGTVGLGGLGIRVNGFDHLIGGTTPDARNIISGNNTNGIALAATARANRIQGNYIGTDITGTRAIPNGEHGVSVGDPRGGGTNNLIGGTAKGAGNLISGNRRSGVAVYGSDNTVQGNFIGTDVTGTVALPNQEEGVRFGNLQTEGSRRNLIGGTTPGAGNLISGNGRGGLWIDPAADSAAHTIQGNFIGTDVTGTRALGNAYGVAVGTADNLIGGSTTGAGNLISGNRGYGLGVGRSGNVIQGNIVGADLTGLQPLGNGTHGINLGQTSEGNLVGGEVPDEGNVIAFNGTDGVQVERGTQNTFRGNAIWAHASGLGIRLLNNGNNNQAAPQLSDAGTWRGRLRVVGVLHSAASTAYTLEFFASPSCHPSGFGEGQQVVGTHDVTTDAAGAVSFTATFPTSVPRGWVVTATATDPVGNTSAFSGCVAVRGVAAWLQPLALDLAPLRGRGFAPQPLAPSDSAATTEPAAAPVLAWSEVRVPAEADGRLREWRFSRRGAAAEPVEWSPESAERARPLA